MKITTQFDVDTYVKIKEIDDWRGRITSIQICGDRNVDQWYTVRWFMNGELKQADFLESELGEYNDT